MLLVSLELEYEAQPLRSRTSAEAVQKLPLSRGACARALCC